MWRSKRRRALLEYGVVDLVFKILVWIALCSVLGVPAAERLPSAGAFVALIALALGWQIVASAIFAPIDRHDPTDPASVRRAAAAARRAPIAFATLLAVHFCASFVVAAFPTPAHPALRTPGTIAAAIICASVTCGAFILAFSYASWAVASARARLSLESGDAVQPPPQRRFTSIRWGTAAIALGVALTPALWMMSFGFMNDARAKFQAARGWARVAVQELARGVEPTRPERGVAGVSFELVAGAPVVRRRDGLDVVPVELVTALAAKLAADGGADLDDDGTTVALLRTGDGIVGAAAQVGRGASPVWQTLAMCLLAASLFAALTAWMLSSAIVRSVRRLASTLRTIADGAPMAHIGRIPVGGQDEVGALMVAANAMIARLERAHAENREAAESLRLANARLEQRVAERTAALQSSNRDLGDNLRHLKQTQSELADVARRLGMAEVASSVLHNVGNVLNSVNVSLGVLGDKLRRSQVPSLHKALALLAEQSDVACFLTADPRGKLLPSFLTQVAAAMGEDHVELTRELRFLEKNVDHIKSVVTRQQAHGRPSGGLVERVSLVGLVDDAARFALADAGDVTLAREHPVDAELAVDRHHVFQILVNLLRNARDALLATPAGARRIVLRTVVEEDQVAVEVADNGSGISPEHRDRLFEMGFTTKPTGHGYGLHSSALAARALGGRITAHSDGPGMGSCFRLELPRVAPAAVAAA